jgi:hypothetical protein
MKAAKPSKTNIIITTRGLLTTDMPILEAE